MVARSAAVHRIVPRYLAAYVKAIRWRSATAADRDLLQAPFRAGIRLMPISCCRYARHCGFLGQFADR